MLCVAFLECPFRKSDVVFTRSVLPGGDLCVVNDAGRETVVVEWAFVFLLGCPNNLKRLSSDTYTFGGNRVKFGFGFEAGKDIFA